LTGTAGGTFYAVQGANIALQAAIGSRTGGVQGAVAGVVNGTLQSLAATNLGALTKGSKELVGKADEIQTMAINNPLIAKTLAATNVSYTKEDGWGIKANLSGVVQALGVRGGLNFERFTNVTIGQSQRGGASVNLGFNTGAGTLGVNYTGATGRFDGSFDIMERQAGTGNLSAELNYGEDGFSVSGNADLGNGLGFGLENGRSGMSGSLTILGSTQGTVDGDGNYEANGNFLGEISGQDIIDLNKTRQQQREAEENERNPVKSAKDAADAKEARDDDAKEVGGEEGPSGLVDLAFAGLGVVMSAGAAFLAGGGSSSASPTTPASGQGAAGNGGNATVARRREDGDDARPSSVVDNNDSNGRFGFDPYNDGTGSTMSDAGVMPAERVNRIENELNRISQESNIPIIVSQATTPGQMISQNSVPDSKSLKIESDLKKLFSSGKEGDSVILTNGSKIVVNKDGGMDLHLTGNQVIKLKSKDDFNHLLSNSFFADNKLKSKLSNTDVRGILELGVEKYYSQYKLEKDQNGRIVNKGNKVTLPDGSIGYIAGNPNAKNIRGEGSYNYLMSGQAFKDDADFVKTKQNGNYKDPERGNSYTFYSSDNDALVNQLNCTYDSYVNVLKAQGLVRPDKTLMQVDQDLAKKGVGFGTVRNWPGSELENVALKKKQKELGRKLTKDEIRVVKSSVTKVDQGIHQTVLNISSESDWAKLTGENKKYKLKVLSESEMTKQIDKGNVVLFRSKSETPVWNDVHNVVVTSRFNMSHNGKNVQVFSTDDSLSPRNSFNTGLATMTEANRINLFNSSVHHSNSSTRSRIGLVEDK
jgi:hypothetical protein